MSISNDNKQQSLPTTDQLKWFRKNNLNEPKNIDKNNIDKQKYYIVMTSDVNADKQEFKVGRYVKSNTEQHNYGGEVYDTTYNIFEDPNNKQFKTDNKFNGVIYEIPENINSIIPPTPTDEEKKKFPNDTQLEWFRFGEKPSYEPDTTKQYYLDNNPNPTKNNYYLFRKDESSPLNVGYLFNEFSKKEGVSYGGDYVEWNTENYEFKLLDGSIYIMKVSTSREDMNVYDIPNNIPTSPPPPPLRPPPPKGVFKRIISITVESKTHDIGYRNMKSNNLVYTLKYHDGSSKQIVHDPFNETAFNSISYIEVKEGSEHIINPLYNLLTDPTKTFSGTHLNLEAIQGTCSDDINNMKKLFMKFIVDTEDTTKLTPAETSYINLENDIDISSLNEAINESNPITKDELTGLCVELPAKIIDRTKKDDLVELTRNLTDDEKTFVKTYVIHGDYIYQVKLDEFTPEKSSFLQGEVFTTPASFKISSMVNQYKNVVKKLYVKKIDMEEIAKTKDMDDADKAKTKSSSDIYYKKITRTVEIGDEVYFYDPADTNKETAIKCKVTKKNTTGLFSKNVMSYNVEYSDESQTTKTTTVKELYEIDQGRTIGGGRRRKTRNVFKKKHSQNKRASRIRNSLKRKSLNKRRQQYTRKYSRTNYRK